MSYGSPAPTPLKPDTPVLAFKEEKKDVPVVQEGIDLTLDQLIVEAIHSHFQNAIDANDEKLRTYLDRYGTSDKSATTLICNRFKEFSIELAEKREKTKKFGLSIDIGTRTVIANVINVYYGP
jgi:hypothetical protein